jgi:hypothetical protein
VLVVLVTLLLAGARTDAVEAGADPVPTVQACDADYDVLAPAPRHATLQSPRATAPLRPGTPVATAPAGPEDAPPAPVRAPRSPALDALRTVVLRC